MRFQGASVQVDPQEWYRGSHGLDVYVGDEA